MRRNYEILVGDKTQVSYEVITLKKIYKIYILRE